MLPDALPGSFLAGLAQFEEAPGVPGADRLAELVALLDGLDRREHLVGQVVDIVPDEFDSAVDDRERVHAIVGGAEPVPLDSNGARDAPWMDARASNVVTRSGMVEAKGSNSDRISSRNSFVAAELGMWNGQGVCSEFEPNSGSQTSTMTSWRTWLAFRVGSTPSASKGRQ